MTHQATTDLQFDSLSGWLHWLETTRPEQEIDLGLDRIRKVAEKNNLLKPAPYVITVGGTNGKGSTVALLESILLQAGYDVGVYTSPHLIRFNERVRVNGKDASDETLAESFFKVNSGRYTTWLTYFEFAVLVAVDCFQKAGVDIAIMEVGLGGRLDATNLIEPDVSVITTVGLDHQDWLGYSIEAIAKEKAGIIRPEKPVVYGDLNVPASIINSVVSLDSVLYRREKEFDIELHERGWSWIGLSVKGEKVSYEDLPVPDLIIDNAGTALQVLQFLPELPSYKDICAGLESARLSGRCQKITVQNEGGDSVELILDVAHNPQAASRLVERLKRVPSTGITRVLFAVCNDKDYAGVIQELAGVAREWLVTEFESPRALSAELLESVVKRRHEVVVKKAASVAEGYSRLLSESRAGDRILVTGSFMTVASVIELLEQ